MEGWDWLILLVVVVVVVSLLGDIDQILGAFGRDKRRVKRGDHDLSPQSEEAFAAVRDEDAVALQSLFEQGLEADKAVQGSRTLLLQAAYRGNVEICSILIQNGANVNAIEPGVETSVLGIAALMGGNLALVEMLLDRGAVPAHGGELDVGGISHAQPGIARALRKHGHHIGGEDELLSGSPLFRAIDNDDADGVTRLIADGNSVNARNQMGYTCLGLAAAYGNLEVCRALLNARPRLEDEQRSGDGTALWIACRAGHRDIVELLLGSSSNAYATSRGKALLKQMRRNKKRWQEPSCNLLLEHR